MKSGEMRSRVGIPTAGVGVVRTTVDLSLSLYRVARLLLTESGEERAPEQLVRQVLEATGAARGFVVVREGDSLQQRFHVGFDRDEIPHELQHLGRSVVRRALETGEVVDSLSLPSDLRFRDLPGEQGLGAEAVIVAPLAHRGEVYGTFYLSYRSSPGVIPPEVRRFLAEVGAMAGSPFHAAIEREALRRHGRDLERDLFSRHDFAGIVTGAPAMVDLLRAVAQVAGSDATVLVRGETGTGKELVARALHMNSPRRPRPFVTLHTAALPGTMLESELFGHVKGAFTGADRDRAGRVAAADGGTLFLDEIAEIATDVQAKLLRFLQYGEIQRLGSDRAQTVDVRVVAATHQDLAALVRAGRFREDLYYRLRVIELIVPPLRDRRGDVPLLSDHFLRRFAQPSSTPARFTPRAERALAAHAFPGNVRELAHAVERACVLARGPDLDVDLLPAEIAGGAAGEPAAPGAAQGGGFPEFTADALEHAREAAAARVEREFLEGLMRLSQGNVSEAARRSGIHRSQLQKMRARHRP